LHFEAELARDRLDGVNRSSVHIGLASFAKTSVTDRNVEPFQEAFQRCRPAIHGRGLNDFGREEPAIAGAEGRHRGIDHWLLRLGWARSVPAALKTSVAGESRSTRTSTMPDSPCCKGIRRAEFVRTLSSTRSCPSRGSWATPVTTAATLPYCPQGNPA